MTRNAWVLVAVGVVIYGAVWGATSRVERRIAALEADSCSVWTERRGIIGWESPKIRSGPDGPIALWAAGAPTGAESEWYDFADAMLPAGELQYGIGRDAIRSIDDPYFVPPDDPRLLGIPPSPYRWCDRPRSNDEIMVIGYEIDGEPRAYPTALLDRHEVVNDRSRGQGTPFTVGW